jgi:hypothetical protein
MLFYQGDPFAGDAKMRFGFLRKFTIFEKTEKIWSHHPIKAYGGNLKQMSIGQYAIFSGDTDQADILYNYTLTLDFSKIFIKLQFVSWTINYNYLI